MSGLVLRNRQRVRPVDLPLFRRIATTVLTEEFEEKGYALCVHLVAAAEMTRLNQHFLNHEGSTDVITFSHAPAPTGDSRPAIYGELFICVDEAVIQARRFQTTWQAELLRYFVHGVLHLRGHDDHRAADRRKMKREENRVLRELARRFTLSRLRRHRKLTR